VDEYRPPTAPAAEPLLVNPAGKEPASSPAAAIPAPAALTPDPDPPSLLDRLFGWLSGRSDQIAALSAAIADTPSQPMNYVRRGELRLAQDDFTGAAADFEQGLALAREQLAVDRWGLVAQAAQDRAAAGLADIRARAAVEGDSA